ncbi:hypothetical protein [Sorangium sp. So ce131]|uniref:hypothetical protein n=1 Tax=Sorangium sp. So ce131 TaxID=3133282 RepID=UPI003F6011C2
MQRQLLSSRLPVLLLASGALLSGCNTLFGITPGTQGNPGAGGSTGADTSSSSGGVGAGGSMSSAGGGGSPATDIAETFSYPGKVGWAFSPADVSGSAHDVTYDAEGNMLFTGVFAPNDSINPSADFGTGSTPIEHGDSFSAFVAKYGPRGEPRWWTMLVGPEVQQGNGVAADAEGAVFVTGTHMASAYWPQADVFTGRDDTTDIFVTKLDADGAHVWSKLFGDEDDQWGVRTAVDSEGNVVVAGVGYGSVPLDAEVFRGYQDDPTQEHVPGVFVLKLSSDGERVVWGWKFPVGFSCSPPGSGFQRAQCGAVGLAIDGFDNVVLAASTTSDAGLGRNNGVQFEDSRGGIDIVVWKLDAAGVPQWGRLIGGDDDDAQQNGDQWASSVAVNPAGEILLTGGFKKSIRFGEQPSEHVVAGREDGDIFMAKLSPSGAPIWEKAFGDVGLDEALGIAVDRFSNIGLVGYLRTEGEQPEGVDFGDGNRLAEGIPDPTVTSDVFIAKFSDRGALRWARRIGNDPDDAGGDWAEGDQAGMAIALDRSSPDQPGNAAVCGWFFGAATFGPGTMDRKSAVFTPFMAKYGP